MRRTILATTLFALAVLVLAPAAWAGPPGIWTQVTASGLANIRQVSLARTPDGVLHVAWAGPGYAETQILERPISAAGALLTDAQTVLPASTSIGDPALLAAGGGLWAFYAGFFLGGQDGLAYSSLNAGLWSIPTLATSAGGAYLATPSVVQTADGTFFEAWDSESGVFVHRGLLSASAPVEFNNVDLGPTGYYANLASETGTSRIWLAWSRIPDALHPGTNGVWVRMVDPATGAPAGTPYRLPGSTTTYNGAPEFVIMQSRTPMASRPAGGGVYVAYPTGYPTTKGVRLWKLGTDAAGSAATSTSVAIAAGSATKDDVAVAADPTGRLWVLWTQNGGSRTAVYARRSNAAATAFGAPVTVLVPAGTTSVWRLAADAQAGRVDVLAHLEKDGASATWHTQLLPGLSVTLSKTTLKAGTKYTLVVAVKDAGAAVAGAKVKVGSKVGKTNASGKATLKVGPFSHGSVAVMVTGTGYATVATRLRVK